MCLPWWTWPRCATRWRTSAAIRRRSTRSCRAISSSITASWSTNSAPSARSRITSISNTAATSNATSSCAGVRIASRTSASSRPAPASATRSNLEYLAQSVWTSADPSGAQVAYPDTLVGTDSHTTMVNALGVLGLGRGRDRGRSRDARPTRLDAHPRSSGDAPDGSPCRRRDRDRSRADRHPDAARARRRRPLRRVLRRGARGVNPARSRHHFEHGTRIRGHLRLLPG